MILAKLFSEQERSQTFLARFYPGMKFRRMEAPLTGIHEMSSKDPIYVRVVGANDETRALVSHCIQARPEASDPNLENSLTPRLPPLIADTTPQHVDVRLLRVGSFVDYVRVSAFRSAHSFAISWMQQNNQSVKLILVRLHNQQMCRC